jgi:hypothetical protein
MQAIKHNCNLDYTDIYGNRVYEYVGEVEK